MTTVVKTEEQASQEVAKHSLSIETAIKAISDSLVMGRKALNTELAVCLAIFAAEGNAEQETKAMVTEVYIQAGYDAANSTSRHYKTVNRRVNAAAGLFLMIGANQVLEWVGKTQEDKMIGAILKGLDTYQFTSMDDVLEFCGRPSNRTIKTNNQQDAEATGQQEQTAQGEDQGQNKAQEGQPQGPKQKPTLKTVAFKVGRVKVEVPEDMKSEDMVKLAAKILSAARIKEQQELHLAIAHPSEAPHVGAVLMH